MRFLFVLNQYLLFLLKSGNEHGLHSPFVFDFYTKVVLAKKNYYTFEEIEEVRNQMLCNPDTVLVTDFGTGKSHDVRKISTIAEKSLKEKKIAQLLFKTILYFKPQQVVELGTSLGITTSYLAKAKGNVSVTTFEGCANISRIAKQNWQTLKINNINVVEGNIDQTLLQFLEKKPKLDLVFFDANHTLKATVYYFELCLNYTHEQSVFVFDDIHWSSEMNQAWEIIRASPKVSLSIDFFHIGIVFFRKNQPKQHFLLRI